MKKIIALTIALMAILSIGLPGSHGVGMCGSSFIPPAHAQVVNHDVILNTLRGMKEDINRMIQLVERHGAGVINVGEETVTLSAAQQTQMINRYTALKTGLAAKYQQLP